MPAAPVHDPATPTLEVLLALPGLTLLEFGADWCGHCKAARPLLERALAGRGDIRHIRIEDGPGRAPGRAFRVKLWPTLVLLHDGVEVGRVVRPASLEQLAPVLDPGPDARPTGVA